MVFDIIRQKNLCFCFLASDLVTLNGELEQGVGGGWVIISGLTRTFYVFSV